MTDLPPNAESVPPPRGRWLHAHTRDCAVQVWFQGVGPQDGNDAPRCTCICGFAWAWEGCEDDHLHKCRHPENHPGRHVCKCRSWQPGTTVTPPGGQA